VAARIEEGVEVFLLDAVEANGLVELSLRSRVLLEPAREIGAKFGFVAFGIIGGRPPFGDASVISTPASLKTK
jgi:hypothetical protein